MSKVNNSILKGANEALKYAKGDKKGSVTHAVKIPDDIDVKEIRENLNMSRQEFSTTFALSLRTIEKWERGERRPEGPTRAYLLVIAKHPNLVKDSLNAWRQPAQ